MPLFKAGEFTSHSGIQLGWKIDCEDGLKDPENWAVMAKLVADRFQFNSVYGIPKGGIQFAEALQPYCSPFEEGRTRMLIVDDVLTTGGSMEEAREKFKSLAECQGVVLYARAKWPCWVWPIFSLSPVFRLP